MLVKTPRCIYPSIFNRFPVIQTGNLKIRHFSTFFAHFGLPVYSPRTIAVNFTWIEKEFSAYQTLRSMYPSTFNRFWEVIGRKLRYFHTPPLFSGPAGVTPSEFREDLDIHKTRMNGLSCSEESMTIYSAVLIQYQRVTDRQTDRQTDVQPISITCFSIADARKNAPFFWDTV